MEDISIKGNKTEEENVMHKCGVPKHDKTESEQIGNICHNPHRDGKDLSDDNDECQETAKINMENHSDSDRNSKLAIDRRTLSLPSSQFHARFEENVNVHDIDNDNQIPSEKLWHRQSDDDRTVSNESHKKPISPRRYQSNRHNNKSHSAAVDLKASTIRQHYYPEGSWGWVIVVCAMLSHMITSGLQLSFGVFLIHLTKQSFARDKYMDGVWMGSISLSMTYIVSPIVVSWCKRKSTRLTAIIGGLIASLGCLFASFASQFHQLMLSYAIFLGIGVGIVNSSANLMVGQYFKRKRPFVEIFIQSSFGIGVSVMSLYLNWSFSVRHWRVGLQLITCAVFVTFFISVLYRPASLYHPQRRAILHLKTQRRKIREKNPQPNKPPFFDLTPLKTRSIQIIMASGAIFSLGFLSPLFYFTKIAPMDAAIGFPSIIPKQILNLQIYFGIAFILGVIIIGFVTSNKSAECHINRLYLCQTVMILNSLLLIIPIFLNNTYYYGHLLFVICYGISIGSFFYIYKMLLFSKVRAKTFGKAWAWVQWAQSVPILLGIPITGYINSMAHYHYGFAFSAICCFIGSLVLFFLSPDSRNEVTIVNNVDSCQQHLCSPSDHHHNDLQQNVANANSYSSDNAFMEIKDGHCCGCGQQLKLNANIDNQQEQAQDEDFGPPSPKRYRRTEDDDFDDDDDDFLCNKLQSHGGDMGTFFSEDLYNYYLQNELEDDDDIYYNDADMVRERILPINEFEENNIINHPITSMASNEHPKKHFICDNTVNKYVAVKRTIDTVAEETSNC